MMQGYVLGARDGERMFNSSGEVAIKVIRPEVRRTYLLAPNWCPQGLGFRAMCMPTGMR